MEKKVKKILTIRAKTVFSRSRQLRLKGVFWPKTRQNLSHFCSKSRKSGAGILSFFIGKIYILSWVALVAQSVERVLGKDEVTGSNPVKGSGLNNNNNKKHKR